jgi:hypothetical protein
VVSFLGYRSGDPGSIPGTTRGKKVVGLERGPLSLVSTTEELLDRKVAAGIRHADHVAPSIRKKLAITSPKSGGRSGLMEFSLVFHLCFPVIYSVYLLFPLFLFLFHFSFVPFCFLFVTIFSVRTSPRILFFFL